MSQPLPQPWTVDDFLAWEALQGERYEFVDGVVRAMVGGSNAHTIIKGNVFAALHAQLRRSPCRALAEGAKIVTAQASLYPDCIVTCAPIDVAEDHVREPAAVVEVLSRSTADYDRGAKWVSYRGIASLRHYVLVAQDRRRVELFTRSEAGWTFQIIEPPEVSVALPSVDAALALDEVYAGSGA
jgi:Uma2 family endonuclease